MSFIHSKMRDIINKAIDYSESVSGAPVSIPLGTLRDIRGELTALSQSLGTSQRQVVEKDKEINGLKTENARLADRLAKVGKPAPLKIEKSADYRSGDGYTLRKGASVFFNLNGVCYAGVIRHVGKSYTTVGHRGNRTYKRLNSKLFYHKDGYDKAFKKVSPKSTNTIPTFKIGEYVHFYAAGENSDRPCVGMIRGISGGRYQVGRLGVTYRRAFSRVWSTYEEAVRNKPRKRAPKKVYTTADGVRITVGKTFVWFKISTRYPNYKWEVGKVVRVTPYGNLMIQKVNQRPARERNSVPTNYVRSSNRTWNVRPLSYSL